MALCLHIVACKCLKKTINFVPQHVVIQRECKYVISSLEGKVHHFLLTMGSCRLCLIICFYKNRIFLQGVYSVTVWALVAWRSSSGKQWRVSWKQLKPLWVWPVVCTVVLKHGRIVCVLLFFSQKFKGFLRVSMKKQNFKCRHKIRY